MERLTKVLLCLAPVLYYSAITASADTNGSSPGQINIAPVSRIATSVSGPVDSKFHASESKWSSPVTSTEPNWARYDRQIGRDITVDTYYYHAISSISITMKQDPKAGVYYPQEVTFEVLENGKWYLLGMVPTQIPASDPNITTQTFTMPCNDVFAKEFRIHFSVNGWVFADNLQVIADNLATPTGGATTDLPPAPAPVGSPLSIVDPNAIGIRDMLLVYTGAHGALGTWSEADFLPMVSYVNTSGRPSGRMFNTMLFLPYAGLPDTKSGWQSYISQLFRTKQNLYALDAAVSNANVALSVYGNNPIQENVVLALPNPLYGDGTWGKLPNGTELSFKGSASDPGAAIGRTQAIQWFLNEVINDWKLANFKNLKLAGFYWLNEQVNYTVPQQLNFTENGVEAVHQAGYPLFWIPSYDASGLDQWSQIGFDAAWLQSHYIFLGKRAPVQRLSNAAALANEYGLGIEVELPQQAVSSQLYRNMYERSLATFKATGLGENVSHAFYAGSKLLVDAARSKNPKFRAVYDETYGFVNHQ